MKRTAFLLGTNLLFGAAALGYLLHWYGSPALEMLRERPSVPLLLAFGGAVAAVLVVDTLRWRTILAGFGTAPGLHRLTAFHAAGQSLSSLVPIGAEPLRVYLLLQESVPGGTAIASVAVDRALDTGASAAFGCFCAALLLCRGVPELIAPLMTVGLVAAGFALGVTLTVLRLRRGAGIVTALAHCTGLDRLHLIQSQLRMLSEAEDAAVRLLGQPWRLGRALAVGFVSIVVVLLECHLLLAAFGLPAGPLAAMTALLATGAAYLLPVPAVVGALEGAAMWLFGVLGHPPEVGLAVGLALRLREFVWVLPGLLYLSLRGLAYPGANRHVHPASASPEAQPRDLAPECALAAAGAESREQALRVTAASISKRVADSREEASAPRGRAARGPGEDT